MLLVIMIGFTLIPTSMDRVGAKCIGVDNSYDAENWRESILMDNWTL